MKNKRLAAGLLALTFVFGGAVSSGAPVILQTITAQAESVEADCYTFDAETGVLTLKGEVDCDAVKNISFKDSVKSVVAEKGTVFPEDSSKMFTNYKSCTSIELLNVDTSKVTDMGYMFVFCTALSSLDISGFDTSKR